MNIGLRVIPKAMPLIGLCFSFHTKLELTKCLLERSGEGRSVEGRKKRQEVSA